MSLKIIISGGGTGGHIFPAVAIANELKNQIPSVEILFVGAQGKMEMEKVPKAGYKIIGLPIVGINRSNMLVNLKFPFKLLQSLYIGFKLLRKFKPDIAIGVGGFASGPTLMMANFLKIKTFIQEQNSYPGITNKRLAKKAEKICVAYPGMEAYFPAKKIEFTGNPVRMELFEKSVAKVDALKFFNLENNKKTILIIGGSLGAKSINEAILNNLEALTDQYQIIWQTGKNFINQAQESAKNYRGIFVADFIYEMQNAYSAADLVISRAGALSVSELAIVAKPAILVPFPFAAEDHQTKNAESLSNKQAAILIKDSELNEKLLSTTLQLMADSQKLQNMSENIKKFAKPLAAKEIVNQIMQIVNK